MTGGNSGYAAARARLERLLGARKTTRDFRPAALAFDGSPGFGKPKSSLDAARETVLTEKLASKTRRKLGLSSGEQLDCPGLVKRLGGDPEQFPPVTRIALEAWLERVPDDALDEVGAAFEPLVGYQLVTRVKPGRFHRLPYDGAFLFPSRIEAESRGLEEDEKDTLPLLDALKAIRDRLHKDFGEPTPYFAVLRADGDHMGAFIDAHDNEAAHVDVTRALAGFAGQARSIVEDHRGACVYAGGDDVLALLPIHRAVECARALRDAFAVVVQSLSAPGVGLPTLSVGLGLGHVLTPFGRLLDLGRRAEKLAKEGPEGITKEKRNALAIIVGIRSGAEIAVRGRWASGLDQRLADWMGYFHEDRLSDKTPYNLREAASRVAWAEGQPNYKTIYNTIAAQEADRVLAKKRGEGGTQELADDVRSSVTNAIEKHGLDTITAELLVARWLAQKAKE
jgi:CRISPR-associated protein Cmr2